MQKEVMVAGMQLMDRLNVVDQWKQRVWEILTEYNEEYFKILNLEGAAYNGEKIRIGRGEGRATHSYHFFDLMVFLFENGKLEGVKRENDLVELLAEKTEISKKDYLQPLLSKRIKAFKVLKNVQICNKTISKYVFFNPEMYRLYADVFKEPYKQEFEYFMKTMGDEMMVENYENVSGTRKIIFTSNGRKTTKSLFVQQMIDYMMTNKLLVHDSKALISFMMNHTNFKSRNALRAIIGRYLNEE